MTTASIERRLKFRAPLLWLLFTLNNYIYDLGLLDWSYTVWFVFRPLGRASIKGS
jgi:hypothetical protein